MIHFINVFAFWYYVKYLAGINWYFIFLGYVVVQWLSHVWLFVTPWTVARQLPCPSPSPFQSLLKFMFIESSDAIQPSHPLLLLPSIFPSIRVFSNKSALHVRWPSTGHESFQWIFWIDSLSDWLVWFPCWPRDSQVLSSTTVQKHQFFSTLPSLWSSSHIHTWILEKPKLWLDGPLFGKVMSLLSNMLSRFVIAFLPKSRLLLIFMEPKKRKSVIVSIVSPSIFHEVMGPVAMN